MKKIFSIVSIVLVLSLLCVSAVACKEQENEEEGINYVDYSLENSYEVERLEDKELVSYIPKDVTPKYGLIFYIGTAIPPENYDYLGQALAKQGYVVAIPKGCGAFAYMMYTETEVAFSRYPNIEFFVGGHSQGGGAAVKRIQENLDKVKGAVLYAPLCYSTDTIKDSGKPTLLLEATKDNVLTPDMKSDAKSRLPSSREEHMLEGCHMSFSTMDQDFTLSLFNDGPLTNEQKQAQKDETVRLTLAFMKSVVVL
jgi:predicted esterase